MTRGSVNDPASMRRVAVEVVRCLREAGHEAWFVGGCVREMLLGKPPKDFDVTSSALPDVVEALFPHTVAVGKAFGVITIVKEGVHVEVATFRTEGGYSDGRRPDAIRFASAEEDVARRDFTINALLYDPVEDRLVDHVGGQADLEARVLRTVGLARERFEEDHLRILRAVRFSARLGFDLAEEATLAAKALAGRVARVSPERIREELTRMLLDPSRGAAFRLMSELGVLEHVLPELSASAGCEQGADYHPEGDVLVHVLKCLDQLPDEVTETAAWGLLLHDIGKPGTRSVEGERIRFLGHETLGAEMAEDLMRRLHFSVADRKRVVALVRRHLQPRQAKNMKRSTLRKLVADDLFEDLMVVCKADALGGSGDVSHVEYLLDVRAELGEEVALPAPLLTGSDLAQAGLSPGPHFGSILRRIRDEQLDGLLDSRMAALERLAEILGNLDD